MLTKAERHFDRRSARNVYDRRLKLFTIYREYQDLVKKVLSNIRKFLSGSAYIRGNLSPQKLKINARPDLSVLHGI